MRWDGIGSRAQVVRWDLESRVESFSSVIAEKLVLGEEDRAAVWRVCGDCVLKLSLMLTIFCLKNVAKSSAEMRGEGGGAGGRRRELKVLKSCFGLWDREDMRDEK